MQLQRGPAAASASDGSDGGGGEADIIGAGWFTPIWGGWSEFVWEEQPDGRWRVYEPWGGTSSIWEGTPDEAHYSPRPSATFRCVELTARANWAEGMWTQHVGVLQGVSMTDVRWEAQWGNPSTTDPSMSDGIGNRFSTWGNVIVVEQINTGGSGGPGGLDWTETLTATAYSGGSAVATIILHCFHQAY